MTDGSENMPVRNEAVLKLFRPAELSLDRLPVLRRVFNDLAAGFEFELSGVLHHAAAVAMDDCRIGNLDEFLSSIEGGIAYTYRAHGWANAPVIFGVDRSFVFSMVDAMYGYDEGEAPSSPERKYTATEIRVVQRSLEILIAKLKQLFDPIGPTEFVYDSLDTDDEIPRLGGQANTVALARLALQLPARSGTIYLFIPMSAFSSFRDKLEGDKRTENAAIDSEWERQLSATVTNSNIEVRAAMDGGSLPIKRIMTLEVGSILEIPADAHNAVALSVNNTQIGECALAKSRGQYAVKIKRFSDDAPDDHEPEYDLP